MGILFKNPFFSVEGQVERVTNVGLTLNAAFNPFSSNKVVANVSNPTLKAGLELGANHPYVSAAVVAGGITAIANPAAALNVAKAFVPKSAIGKVAGALAIPLVGSAIIGNPKTSFNAANSSIDAYNDALKVANNPSLGSAEDYLKAHPYASAAAATAGLVAAGFSLSSISGLIANYYNTDAVKENTNQSKKNNSKTTQPPPTPTTSDNNLPTTTSGGSVKTLPTNPLLPQLPATQALPSGRGAGGGKSPRKKVQNISQRVNILINNKNSNSNKRYLNREVLIH